MLMFFSLHSEFLAEAGTPASNPVDVEIDLTGNESDTSRRSDILWQLDVCVLYSNM